MTNADLRPAQTDAATTGERKPSSHLVVESPRILEARLVRKDFEALAALEAAYRLDLDETEWLTTLLAELQPVLDQGLGVSGWFWRFQADSLEIVKPTYLCCADTLHEAYCIATQRGPVSAFRLLNAHGRFATNSEIIGHRQLAELGPLPGGLSDQVTLSVPTSPDFGLTLAGPAPAFARIAPRTRHVVRQVGLHITAASRLRFGIAADTSAGGDTFFDARGRLLDAAPDARETRARRQLEAVVRAFRASRGHLRTESPAQALALWTALLEGEWTVFEHVDTDGKRLLVARRNKSKKMRLGGLSERERVIVSRVARGDSSKEIAHDLEMPKSSVSADLKCALRKLGFRDRMELVRLTQGSMLDQSP